MSVKLDVKVSSFCSDERFATKFHERFAIEKMSAPLLILTSGPLSKRLAPRYRIDDPYATEV